MPTAVRIRKAALLQGMQFCTQSLPIMPARTYLRSIFHVDCDLCPPRLEKNLQEGLQIKCARHSQAGQGIVTCVLQRNTVLPMPCRSLRPFCWNTFVCIKCMHGFFSFATGSPCIQQCIKVVTLTCGNSVVIHMQHSCSRRSATPAFYVHTM